MSYCGEGGVLIALREGLEARNDHSEYSASSVSVMVLLNSIQCLVERQSTFLRQTNDKTVQTSSIPQHALFLLTREWVLSLLHPVVFWCDL